MEGGKEISYRQMRPRLPKGRGKKYVKKRGRDSRVVLYIITRQRGREGWSDRETIEIGRCERRGKGQFEGEKEKKREENNTTESSAHLSL